MLLILSVYITNDRSNNRYSRDEIFAYMLKSYKNIPFTEIYLFILIDNKLLNPNNYFYKNDLTQFIYNNFNKLPNDKIHIKYTRYTTQNEWINFIQHIYIKHGKDELAWFIQNDDHIFVDYNMDILLEGIEHLKKEQSTHKSIYLSHWPEILKMSGKYQTPTLINNYINFNLSLLDSIQIFNLQFLYDIFINYIWKHQHIRIDSLLNEITNTPSQDNPLNQIIYVPLRELLRHFDGYTHVSMDSNACGPLILPTNMFFYSKEKLKNKMTASHNSFWTLNNNFIIPNEWIDINYNLHKISNFIVNDYMYNGSIHNIPTNTIPISLGWNCDPAILRATNLLFTKINGYKTCPFDLCVTPFYGLCNCLLDNFDRAKFFNLRVEYDPINKQDCILNEYNMWFNHESEKNENDENVLWHPGKWKENNYKLFIEKYELRIQNFLNYIKSHSILFIVNNNYDNMDELINIIKYSYPCITFNIMNVNIKNELYFLQHLHSPGFPINNNDNNYIITNKNYILKTHYRAIILVLASNNNNIDKNCRFIWKKYMKLDPTIKVFFVYGKIINLLIDYDPTCDLIYEDISESYPVLIHKTIRAMETLQSLYTYDYFIRTNLSTFWDFNKLNLHLNELPTSNCYSGDGPLPGYTQNGYYLSGTDTIVTSEMIQSIIDNKHLIRYDVVEDAAMGLYFNGILKAPMLPNRICFFEDIINASLQDFEIMERINISIQNNKDHYRIKNTNNREINDLYIYIKLLKIIYNIEI
jgi:hypothetical protein